MPVLTFCTFKGLKTKFAATTADSGSWGGKQAIFSVSTVVHKIRIDWLGEKKLNQVAIFNTRPTCMYRDMFVDINW